jgi:hypothetical protein
VSGTIMDLTGQAAQVMWCRDAAARLMPGGDESNQLVSMWEEPTAETSKSRPDRAAPGLGERRDAGATRLASRHACAERSRTSPRSSLILRMAASESASLDGHHWRAEAAARVAGRP